MILIYLGLILALLYYLITKNYDYWKSRGIPYEKPFSVFGNFYDVIRRKQHISHLFRDYYTKFESEPYFGMFVFNQPNLVVRSPEILKKILVKDADKFINRKIASNENVDPIATHTLFSAQDEVWKNLRAKISPVFSSGKIKLMFPLMQECALDLASYFEKGSGQVHQVREVTKKYAIDIISSCAFGINAYCLKDENSEILKVATKLQDLKSFVRNFSIFSFFFAHKFVDIFRLTFLDKTSSDYLISTFNQTLKEREKQNISRHDLIDLLNNLKRNEKFSDTYKFDDVKMAAQAIAFFSAGNDTTSITISFAFYELALNPDIQERLRREVRENFEKHGGFTYEGIQEMKYLDMVLNETLRKYPLTTFLNRKSATKYTFEETGLTIDKDLVILVPVSGLHYDPKYYPDPEKFDPERFNDENKSKIVPYTFLPFGDGPRNCIGQRFALIVSKVALAYAVKDFVFEKVKETTVPLELDASSIFMENKDGIKLKVYKI